MPEPDPRATALSWGEAIVAQAAEAIVAVDREGVIRLWNRGAEAVFGYAAAEALGRGVDLIIPERFRAAHWNGFRRALESGRTVNGERVLTTRSMHKDGRKLYLELSFGLLRDGSGRVVGAFAIGRDGTARQGAAAAAGPRSVGPSAASDGLPPDPPI